MLAYNLLSLRASEFSGRYSSTVNVLRCSEQFTSVEIGTQIRVLKRHKKSIQKKTADTTPRHQVLFHLSSVLIADWI